MSPRPDVDLEIRVTPRSSRNKIEVVGPSALKVWVTAPPVDGEANAAVCQTVAKALGIAKSRVAIVGGETSRTKTVRVDGLAWEQVEVKLKA